MTLGSHQRTIGKSQVYLTPKWLIDALGPFDCDPCAADPRPWDCAKQNISVNRGDGLHEPWEGMVWLNPPFDRREIGAWIARLAQHGNGLALVHARTETDWFGRIWDSATALLFLDARLKFVDEQGQPYSANSGAPPVLCAFGGEAVQRLFDAQISGRLVFRWATVPGSYALEEAA